MYRFQQAGQEAGKETESLEDGGERGGEDEEGQEQGYLSGVSRLIESRVVVFGEEGENVGYRVRRRGGRWREEVPPEGAEGSGEDAVKAEEGERVGGGQAETTCGGARALLLGVLVEEEGVRGGEGEAHGFEAFDL